MALTLVSLVALATTAMAAPMPQIITDAQQTDPATTPTPTPTSIPCKAQYTSQKDDTCRSIGLPWGLYDYQILEANPFLNCNDIWVGTPICIPDVPLPDTVVYPTATAVVAVCSQTYTANGNETCDSIGASFGVSGAEILAANPFLNCNDIWQYTPVCIPYPVIPTTTVSVTTVSLPPCPQIYTANGNETCDSIGAMFGVPGAAILALNSFLNCNDIWQYTSVCIPFPIISDTFPAPEPSPTVTYRPPPCAQTYTSNGNETCDSIGAMFGLSGAEIHAANTFLNCNDIWQYTPVCIPVQNTTVEPTPVPTTTSPVPVCVQTYTANGNETCDSIGAMFGLSGADILAANSFLNCNDIWQYTPVCIPAIVVIDTFPTASPTETI